MQPQTTESLTYRVVDWHEELPQGLSHREVADVCVDAEDRVILYPRSEHAVIVYERDGRFVRSWGRGTFGRSHGITFGPDGSVYCADDLGHAIRKFSLEGELLMTIGTPGTPSDTGYDGKNLETIRCSAGPFNRCTKLAVAPNGELYVSDGYGNARVHHFTARGELIRSWGAPGTGPGEFHIPHGLCVAADGRVLVADRENDRIQFFSPEGEYLAEWTDVQRPCGVTIDAAGRIYVVELSAKAGSHSYAHGVYPEDRSGRVSVFDSAGRLIARWGEYGCEPGQFIAPHGLAVDSRGDVYVAEVVWTLGVQHGTVPADCHQIQKFTRR